MRGVMLLLLLLSLASCGSGNSCEGVDTSQMPDKITHSGAWYTYYWGDTCSKQVQLF
jgi:hypothetical protein